MHKYMRTPRHSIYRKIHKYDAGDVYSHTHTHLHPLLFTVFIGFYLFLLFEQLISKPFVWFISTWAGRHGWCISWVVRYDLSHSSRIGRGTAAVYRMAARCRIEMSHKNVSFFFFQARTRRVTSASVSAGEQDLLTDWVLVAIMACLTANSNRHGDIHSMSQSRDHNRDRVTVTHE